MLVPTNAVDYTYLKWQCFREDKELIASLKQVSKELCSNFISTDSCIVSVG